MACAMGIMASLFERNHSGKGQVIDSNMVEGKLKENSSILLLFLKIVPAWYMLHYDRMN